MSLVNVILNDVDVKFEFSVNFVGTTQSVGGESCMK